MSECTIDCFLNFVFGCKATFAAGSSSVSSLIGAFCCRGVAAEGRTGMTTDLFDSPRNYSHSGVSFDSSGVNGQIRADSC